jgi:hypothetical protein
MPNNTVRASAIALPNAEEPAFAVTGLELPPDIAVGLVDEPVETRSVLDMVEAWFAAEATFENDSGLTEAEFDEAMKAQSALEDSILRTPSKSQADFVAKIRFAVAMTVHKAGYWRRETDILASVAYECARMCDRDNDAERVAAEKAGSYEGYLAIIGMPMPERPAVAE